jgi:hypothetical protein
MQLMHGLSAKLRRSLNLNNPNGDTEMRPAQSGIEIRVLMNVRSTSRSQSWLNTSPALVIGSNTFFYARTRTNLHAGIAGSDNRNYRSLHENSLASCFHACLASRASSTNWPTTKASKSISALLPQMGFGACRSECVQTTLR